MSEESPKERLERELAYFKERRSAAQRFEYATTVTFYDGVVYGLMIALEILQKGNK